MRRKQDKPAKVHSTGDIKKDLTEKQLIAFGAAALAYNILEDQIDALLGVVTNVPDWLIPEVSSRIHGLDGKVAIIHKTLERSGLDSKDAKFAGESLGAFCEFKKIRDAMIYARIINAAIGIGLSEKARGDKAFEILLTEGALNGYYDHVIALEKEFSSLGPLLAGISTLMSAAPDDPKRSQYEEAFKLMRFNSGRITAVGYH